MRPPRKHAPGAKHKAQEGVPHCFNTTPHALSIFFTLVAVLLAGADAQSGHRDMLVLVFDHPGHCGGNVQHGH